MTQTWIMRWGYLMAPKPTRPGIYRLKDGGYFVRAKVTDPRTKARAEVSRVLHDATIGVAAKEQAELVDAERARVRGKKQTAMRWSEFAASLFEDKVLKNKLKSPASREWWAGALKNYLVPAFGAFLVEELHHTDIEEWTREVAIWMRDGKPVASKKKAKDGEPPPAPRMVKISPRTANGWLRILRTICHAAKKRFDLPKSAFDGVEFFSESTKRTYTKEQPNALPPEMVGAFLDVAKRVAPQHYAMMVLGFVTGLRPSSMRPLRRSGFERDVDWERGLLFVRRSNSRGQEIMDATKTDKDQEIALPPFMMEILKAHVDALPEGPMTKSPYLFPSTKGEMRARTALGKPFAKIAAELGNVKLTARAMRRSFQDLARAAKMHDFITRKTSGHSDEEMQFHYSTAHEAEQREALGKVIRIATRAPKKSAAEGEKKGGKR